MTAATFLQIRIIKPPHYSNSGEYPSWVCLAEFPQVERGGETAWSPIKVEAFGKVADELNALCLDVGSQAITTGTLLTRTVEREGFKQKYEDLRVRSAIPLGVASDAPPIAPAPKSTPPAPITPPPAPAVNYDDGDIPF